MEHSILPLCIFQFYIVVNNIKGLEDRLQKFLLYVLYGQMIHKFGLQVTIMHDQLNGPFGNQIVLNKVLPNYLSACIIDYILFVQEF